MEDYKKVQQSVYLIIISFVFLINVFVINSSFSALPSIESLFRNGNNPDITNTTTILQMAVQKIATDVDNTENQHDNSLGVEIIFNKDGRFWQTVYANALFKEEDIITVREKNNFLEEIKNKKKIVLIKDFFYSSLYSLFLNDAQPMTIGLKRINADFKKNSEMINQEKLRVIRNYQNYLYQIKKNPSLKKSLENPLEPKDPQEYNRIAFIMKQSLVLNLNDVKLAFNEDIFEIHAQLSNFLAKFSNEEHQLLFLSVNSDDESLEMNLSNYEILQDGHYFPKHFTVKTSSENTYRINFHAVRYIDQDHNSLAQKMRKLKEKEGNGGQNIELPDFLY